MESTGADEAWFVAGMHHLILCTVGRRSGKEQKAALPYWVDSGGHRIVVASTTRRARRGRSRWYASWSGAAGERAGGRLMVAGRTLAKVERTAAEIARRGGTARATACDVKREAEIRACVRATVEAFGGVDILVNNAREVPIGTLLSLVVDGGQGYLR